VRRVKARGQAFARALFVVAADLLQAFAHGAQPHASSGSKSPACAACSVNTQ
jgi:hypothetical protein